EDWYHVTTSNIKSVGGKSIIDNHNGSLIKSLQAAYPEFHWEPSFNKFYKHINEKREFLNSISEKLGIEQQMDWHHIDSSKIKSAGGASLLSQFGGVVETLQAMYPEFHWNPVLHHCLPHNFWNNNQRKLF